MCENLSQINHSNLKKKVFFTFLSCHYPSMRNYDFHGLKIAQHSKVCHQVFIILQHLFKIKQKASLLEKLNKSVVNTALTTFKQVSCW